MKRFTLHRAIQILLFFFLVFAGAYFGKPFLAPFTIALLLSMLFLPLSKKLEKKGVSRGLSSFICVLVLAIFIAGLFTLLSTQIAGLTEELPKLQENVTNYISQAKQFISNKFGMSSEQQQQVLEQQKNQGGGQSGKLVAGILGSVSGVLVDTILVFVYIFLLLYFRSHLKNSILKLISHEHKDQTILIISKSSEVATKYLSGLAMMIVMLWIMYGIGFSVIGVKNAIFFAILCGLLEIVPFVGNLTGTSITIIMALTQGGGSGMILGIVITYALVQFIQTYILEPLVVGSEVNINPLFTIIVIVVGEVVWGVPGMILAIPILGIIKVVCDNIEALQPFGFLIGSEKKENDSNLINKLKGWFTSLVCLPSFFYILQDFESTNLY